MGSQESEEKTECEMAVTLPSTTPVVGCLINPAVRLKIKGTPTLQTLRPHSFSFTWYREMGCSVHPSKLATVLCMSCVKLEIPLSQCCHCSPMCLLDGWQIHEKRHCRAAKMIKQRTTGGQEELIRLRSCGSWPDFSSDQLHGENELVVERERRVWVKVGSSKTYEPSMNDVGFILRLECLAVDHTEGIQLAPVNIIVTDPVITFPPHCPRCMIKIRSCQKSHNIHFKPQSSDGLTFSVLSYNILADLYASGGRYSYCPTWALVWEYRRQNLLQEIIEYDADILCLQEVQSDHFESFFKPELIKHGYSVMYKKKRTEDNVALIVILEAIRNSRISDDFQSRICVANTHIHANTELPDVKLYQVANLVCGLEKISQSKIPILICGDVNSPPASDPHMLLVTGRIDSVSGEETDPLGIYQILKLKHSLALVSAYASFFHSTGIEAKQLNRMNPDNHEPLFTHYTPRSVGTLDYILYTADSLTVEGLLELLDSESVGVGLPSPLWSSDHIALMASFRLKTPSSESSPPLPQEI